MDIPRALSLLAAGFPASAAAALLFAGPTIDFPSLASVARVAGWRVATAVAAMVWMLAADAGLIVG